MTSRASHNFMTTHWVGPHFALKTALTCQGMDTIRALKRYAVASGTKLRGSTWIRLVFPAYTTDAQLDWDLEMEAKSIPQMLCCVP